MAKVLLVEDDNNLREIYEARLQAEGYTINSAKDGEEALVVAKAEKPDLIISDVMMPKISGFEMLDILRNTQGLKETKVIMLTALGQADDRTRADSLGADRYLVKSQVTLEDIVKAAHELLEGDTVPTVTPAMATAATASGVAAAPTTPDVTETPAPAMAVSEPPVTAPIPVAAAPEPSAPPAEPVTPPVTITASAPAATPVEPNEAPTAEAPQAPTEVASAPGSFIPPTADDATPPSLSHSDAPVLTPPSETTAAPQEGNDASLPNLELPTPPAAESPTSEAAVESANPTPQAAPEIPGGESTAEEQATVNSQIEDFIKNNAVEVPSEAPTPPPNETTDRVMQESVDTLIASADGTTVPQTETPQAAPETTPEPAAPVPQPSTGEDETSDGVTIAHKKVIARPESIDKPDLSELLAREEAKKIVIGDTPQTPITPETPAPTIQPSMPGQAPLPGNTVSPTNTAPEASQPEKADDETDPNSIAL